MTRFLDIPPSQLEPDTLQALLEEFASRDGTDYGETETPLAERVASLKQQLGSSRLKLVFDQSTQFWDLVDADQAEQLFALESEPVGCDD